VAQRLASLVLRLYPREWRARYEDEVRALFEDRPPALADLPGLLRNAVREWRLSRIDPLQQTFWWSVTGGTAALARMAVAGLTMRFGSEVIGAALHGWLGAPPGWLQVAGFFAFIAAMVRSFPANALFHAMPMSIRLRPLTRREFAACCAALAGELTISEWGQDHYLQSSIFFLVLFMSSTTENAWARSAASATFFNARRDWQSALGEHKRLVDLELRGLANASEVGLARAEVTHLADAARTAARASRVYGPIPSATPLNLN